MTATDTRQDTINRAIALIDTAASADLAGYLAATTIHASMKDRPDALRARLATDAASTRLGARTSAWKAAQQILAAAGLPA